MKKEREIWYAELEDPVYVIVTTVDGDLARYKLDLLCAGS